MQAGQNVYTSGSRMRTVAITALVLFALAGIMSGFALGAVAHRKPTATQPSPQATQPVIAKHTVTQSPTATKQPAVVLGLPQFTSYPTYNEQADGQTSYTITIQVVDKHNPPQPIQKSGIYCKIWLVSHFSGKLNLPDLAHRNDPAQLQQPIPGVIGNHHYNEIQGALSFSSSTPQLQQSNSQGQAKWNYTISPSALDHSGKYYIVALSYSIGTDGSVHFNWSWAEINITGAHGNNDD